MDQANPKPKRKPGRPATGTNYPDRLSVRAPRGTIERVHRCACTEAITVEQWLRDAIESYAEAAELACKAGIG